MNIACWNCHNLNSHPNQKIRENRCNYRSYLQSRIKAGLKMELDVIFLSEVEENYKNSPLASADLTEFVPCKELDEGWNLMSSGILLYHTPAVSLDDSYKLILPVSDAAKANPDWQYGFAVKTTLKKGNESVDAVFFWNTKRKNTPSHGYGATFNFLLDRLLKLNFFDGKSWLIAGDFNLSYSEVDSRCRQKIRNGYTLQGQTNTYFRSFKDQNYCSDLDHLVSSSDTAEMISIKGLNPDDFVGKGLSDHLPIIFRTR